MSNRVAQIIHDSDIRHDRLVFRGITLISGTRRDILRYADANGIDVTFGD